MGHHDLVLKYCAVMNTRDTVGKHLELLGLQQPEFQREMLLELRGWWSSKVIILHHVRHARSPVATSTSSRNLI